MCQIVKYLKIGLIKGNKNGIIVMVIEKMT